MKFNMTLLTLALASASLNVHALPTVMTVTGGTFELGFYTPNGPLPFTNFGSGSLDITDQYNPPAWVTSATQASGHASAIVSFDFGQNTFVNVYTAAQPISPTIGGGGGPAPVFTDSLVNGAFTIDMSSWIFNWQGTDFNQGSANANGTLSNCTATSCDFSMGWTSLIRGGPFGQSGPVGTWVVTGTIAAVPEASAYGMMAAGLALVGFVARRRTRTTG